MNQIFLPPKIKIAAWLMMLSGILLFYQFISVPILILTGPDLAEFSISDFFVGLFLSWPFLAAVLFILFALFLKKGKKWAWFASVVLLLREALAGISSFYVFWGEFSQMRDIKDLIPAQIFYFSIIGSVIFTISYIFVLIALILLFQERKNYW